MANLRISCHGGMCCGIKHIYGFPFYQFELKNKLKPLKACKEQNSRDYNGQWVSSKQRFFTDAAPAETVLERLDRYIQFLHKRRPRGIVEVVLAKCNIGGFDQVSLFHDILVGHGFTLMNENKNSNSGNTIFVYHLNLE